MNIRLFHTKFLLTLSLGWLTLTGDLNAQGFVQQYPFFTWVDGGAQSVFPQADGSFRLTATTFPDFGVDIGLLWIDTDAQGQLVDSESITTSILASPTLFLLEDGDYLSAVNDSNGVSVRRFTADHSLLWSTSVAFPGFQSASVMGLRPNASGEVFVRGMLWYSDSTSVVNGGFVMKFSPEGNLLWETRHPLGVTYILPTSLEPTPDGGCLFANYSYDEPNTSGEAVLRFAGDGSLLWSYTPQNGNLFPYILNYSLAVNALGEALIPVRTVNNTAGIDSLWLHKLAANGQVLGQTNVSAALEVYNLQASLAFPTADGGWIVAVEHYLLNSWRQYVLRLDASGDVVWQKPLNFLTDAFPTEFTDGQELPDGSLVVYGFQQNQLILIKFAADGTIYPHTVIGQVARDSTFDCLLGPNDPPLPGWIVTAEGNGRSQFAATDAAGHYAIPDLDTGDYVINVVPQNYLWNACVDSVLINFPDPLPQTDTIDFLIQPLYDCPIMQIDLGAIGLRRCFSNTYTANYCNVGNQAAQPVTVTIALDPLLQVDSASVPFTQTGDLLHFALGTVAPGECGSFQLYVTVSCEAELGQTLCAEAQISPDTICAPQLPNWLGAAIEVTAGCVGDSVRLTIQNTGNAAMSQALDFIVIDDHVITRQGGFNLQPGGIHYETVPADGSTWRLIAQQEPGFPFGPQMPSVAIEGCNATGNDFSTGMLNMFANYSGDPFHDIACHTVVGSFDPNDKQAFPIGVDNQHFIEPNTPLDYQIRFQNTGTDTAFTVVIKDTLAVWLDPTTVRPGAASHPYTWTLSGAGILTFTFNNILLPDSNVNELKSHGFVQFYVDQRKDVPLGTMLENRAGIYFDFNEPVMTNTVWHTIGRDFLPTATQQPMATSSQLQVWPNPASQTTRIWTEKPFTPGQRLLLRNALGCVVRDLPVQGQTVEIQRTGLPAGLYFVELRNGHGVIGVGKVVWE